MAQKHPVGLQVFSEHSLPACSLMASIEATRLPRRVFLAAQTGDPTLGDGIRYIAARHIINRP